MGVNADNISLVPKFQFSTTLEQQECELITNPLLQRMKQVRKSLENDPSRPIYHYVNPEGRLNEPNGLCFWQGNWHLFLMTKKFLFQDYLFQVFVYFLLNNYKNNYVYVGFDE